MNFGRYLLAVLALVMAVQLSWAQDDPVLQSYSSAIESLDAAVAALGTDSTLARDELDRALQTLRPLSTNASNATLISALENTFERAKVAVQNQSQDDLVVQTSVLKGGFWRLVYESILQAADQGNAVLVQQRLARIATDMGLAADAQAALNGDNARLMLAAFERGIAQTINSRLVSVGQNSETDQGKTYRALASAYGLFLPVQDSPRVSAGTTALFSQAFQAVVANDSETLNQVLTQLVDQMASFEQAANTVVEGSNAAVTAPPVTATTEAPSEAPAEVTTVAAETQPVAETPAPVETSVQTATDSQALETAVVNNEAANSMLIKQLARFGIPPVKQEQLATAYLEEGYSSLNSVLDKLFSDSAKAIVAIEAGDQAHAKALINGFKDTYTNFLMPLVNNRNPSFNSRTLQLLDAFSTAPGLRLQDVVVLTSHVDAISSVLSDNVVSSLHQATVATATIWTGWLRLVFIILLGILSFVPLYLLYLAFGGGNRNWQLVGWALFLLLLPLMYEGLTYLGSLLSNLLGGVAWLEAPARFSIFQNSLSQVAWVVLSAAGIALAFAGLYGICVQFGLLGRRTTSSKASTVMDASVTSAGVNTSFDWDEEF